MFSDLLKYLYETKNLQLPGIGKLTINGTAAIAEIDTDIIQAPSWSVSFFEDRNDAEETKTNELIGWLALKKNISFDETKRQYGQFIQDLKNRLSVGEKIEWEGLGSFVQESGVLSFIPHQKQIAPFSNVPAKKVTRVNTSYASLVGDKETTTGEMRELLATKPVRNKNWAMWVLLGISIVAAVWFFIQNGCNSSVLGNRQKAPIEKPGDTYKIQ